MLIVQLESVRQILEEHRRQDVLQKHSRDDFTRQEEDDDYSECAWIYDADLCREVHK